MVGETGRNPQFSEEAMTLAYKSNFLFDEKRRAEQVLSLAIEHRDEIGSGSEYIAAEEDLRLASGQFTMSVDIAAAALGGEYNQESVEGETGELVVSLGTAFYISHGVLSGLRRSRL